MKLLVLLALLPVVLCGQDFTQYGPDEVEWSLEYGGAENVDSDSDKILTKVTYTMSTSSTPPSSRPNGAQDLSHWVLSLENCLAFSVKSITGITDLAPKGDPTTGFEGVKWDGGLGVGNQQTVTVMIESPAPLLFKAGKAEYAVKGATRFAIGAVEGPSCDTPSVPVCSAGEAQTIHSCSGDVGSQEVSALLCAGASSGGTLTFAWSSDAGVFDDATSSSPKWSIPYPGCQAEYTIGLTITTAQGLTDYCTTTVTFEDQTAPALVGSVVSEVTVEVDDVPNPAIFTLADDSCDGGSYAVQFSKTETTPAANGSYKITRTWEAHDNCDSASTSQTISVVDTTPPTIENVDADVSVSCDAIPPPCEPVALDVSETLISYSSNNVAGHCVNTFTINREWVATDAAGLSTTETQVISVSDTTPPILSAAPEDETVQCDSVPLPPVLTASDNCDGDAISVNFSQVRSGHDDATPEVYIITRTWSATDVCGNSVTETQMITVKDDSGPVFTVPPEADETYECSNVPNPCIVEAEDTCGPVNFQNTTTRTPGSCPNEYDVVHTWVVSDSSGNSATASQTVTVADTAKPVLHGTPSTLSTTIECDDQVGWSVTATDNCDGTVDVHETDVNQPGGCDGNYQFTRTWSVADACGNEDSQSHLVIVQDTTKPQLLGVPSNIEVDCNNIPDQATVQAIDNCDTVSVTPSSSDVRGSCDESFSRVYKWVATDDCGNSITAKQTVTVTDEEAPVMSHLPGHMTGLECDAVPEPATVTATDNCADVTVIFTESSEAGSCPCEYTLVRTWSVVDDCGNAQSHTQTITVDDNTPPTISEPADATATCDDSTGAPTVTASDDQDGVLTPALVEVTASGSCDYDYTIHRTWTATDACGNTATTTQSVDVGDDVAPTLKNLPPVNQQIIEACDTPSVSTVVAEDNCGPATVTFTEVSTAGSCTNQYSIERTWSAVDECGNDSGTVTRSLAVADRTDPVLSPDPENLTVGCNDTPPVPTVTATDCDASVSVVYTPTPGSGVCRTDSRKWTATDACGNSATVSQEVTFVDNTPPVLTVPADSTIDCEATPTTPEATATDDCTSVTPQRTYSNPSEYVHVYTFTVNDACGNSATDATTITMEDTTPPTITVDGDMTLDCEEDEGDLHYTADDNCDPNPTTVEGVTETSAGSCVGTYTKVRSWVVTDHTGRSATDSQTITFEDLTPPTLTGVPESSFTEYSCEVTPPDAPTVTASDNCDTTMSAVAVFTERTTPGANPSDYNLIREWTATDDCGNSISDSQTLSFVDKTPPTINEGFDLVLDAVCVAPAAPTLTGNDNCGLATVTGPVETTDQGTCEYEYTVSRTWTVTDGNGLSVTATQTVSVTDSVAPVWVTDPLPSSETVYSPSDVPAMPTLVASDNCGVVTVSDDETSSPGCSPSDYTLVRTFSATDDCGHSISHDYTITVVDSSYPSISGVPPQSPVSHPCDETYTLPTVTCDGGVVQPTVVASSVEPTCSHETSTTYKWGCTNSCNMYSSDTLTVIQTQGGPTIDVIADHTRECSAQAYAPSTSPDDDCSDAVVSHSSSSDQQDSQLPFDITHTWTVTDDCGETDTTTAVETVVDTTPPTIAFTSEELAELQAEWGSAPNPTVTMVSSADNCNRTVTFTSENVTGTCLYAHLMVNTFTATDNAGNTATVTQTVTVVDTTPPVFDWPEDSAPTDETHSYETLPYGQVPPAPTVTATDPINGDTLTVTFTETSQAGNSPEEFTVTRTWTVEDKCGNTNYHQVTITVVNYPLYDTESECDDQTPALQSDVDTLQTWFDANNPGFTVTGAAVTTPGTCVADYTITRTFTMTDGQGATFTQDYDIVVTDSEAPVFDAFTASYTEECTPPAPDILTATDNCIMFGNSAGQLPADVVTYVDGTQSNNGNVPYSFERTWTAADACGHTSTAVQTINVVDTVPPTLDFMPGDETLECDDQSQDPTGLDNCGGAVTVNEILPAAVEDFDCASNGGVYMVTTRSWRLTDSCGNEKVVSNKVSSEDTTDPTWTSTLPEDASYQCEEVIPEKPTATDTCSATVSVQRTSTPGGPGVNVYTWTAVDDCGNSISTSATITVEDTTPPVLSNLPQDEEAECDEPPVTPPTATDNCVAVTLELAESSVGSCDDSMVITRVWTATDGSDNVATYTQVTTVSDTGAPTLNLNSSPISRGCGSLPAPVDPPASDACDKDALEFNSSDETIPGVCGSQYDVVRTWTATDDCGNTDTAPQTFTFDDSTPPSFDFIPSNYETPCDDDVAPADPVNMLDNCAVGSVVSPVETSSPGSCPEERTIVRTWSADDGCNQAEARQTITVVDNNPPSITVPPPASYECDEPQPPMTASAVDSCEGPVNANFQGTTTVQATSANDYKLVHVWVATDSCGNAATDDQTVTVTDTTPPTFVDVPVDAEWECDDLGDIVAQTNDNCDTVNPAGPTVTTNVGTCADEYELVHSWTAADVSGNTATWTVTVAVVDTTDPEWVTVPQSSISYECEPSPVAKPTASDNCGSDVYVSDVTTTPVTQWVSVRSWTASDVCGNTITTTQTVTVTDTTPPTIDGVLDDFNGPCNSVIPYSSPSADDNCEIDTFLDSEQTSFGSCEGEYTNIYTWVATDMHGNTATDSRTVSIVDTVPPTILNPPQPTAVAECDAVPNAATLNARDDCQVDTFTVEPTRTTQGGACSDEWTITDTWTATDDCGNTDQVTQVTTVLDTTPPLLVDPNDPTAQCDSTIPSWTPSATDNCDDSVSYNPTELTEAGTCEAEYKLIRTYVATDNCGNSATQDQTVTVVDETPPSLNGPEDKTYECTLPDAETLTATDTCGAATVVFTEGPFGPVEDQVTERVWTATDECGNTASHTQYVTTEDTTPPTIDPPADITASCDAIPPFSEDDVTHADSCSSSSIVCTETIQDGTCTHAYTIVRTCIATDAAGNTHSETFTVSVSDTTPPVISGVPASQQDVEFGSAIGSAQDDLVNVLGTDNCAGDRIVDVTEETVPGTCDHEYDLVRTYSAVDECGNSATSTQTVEVVDTTPCIWDDEPLDRTVECDAVPLPCDLFCVGEDISVLRTSVTNGLSTTWTYSAPDECGNDASLSYSIVASDTTPPILSRYPGDETVSCDCDTFPPMADITALDNCDVGITVAKDEQTRAGSGNVLYTLIRTFSATDSIGNSVTHQQTLTVEDTEAPSITHAPANFRVSCDAFSTASHTVYAVDKCDENPNLDPRGDVLVSGSMDCDAVVTRSWVATDNVGNAATQTTTITVFDETAPKETSTAPTLCLAPNNKFARLTLEELFPNVEDNCSSSVTFRSPTIVTSGPENSTYDTNTDSLLLFGGADTVIEVTAVVEDTCGQFSTISRVITVPAEGGEGCIYGTENTP